MDSLLTKCCGHDRMRRMWRSRSSTRSTGFCPDQMESDVSGRLLPTCLEWTDVKWCALPDSNLRPPGSQQPSAEKNKKRATPLHHPREA